MSYISQNRFNKVAAMTALFVALNPLSMFAQAQVANSGFYIGAGGGGAKYNLAVIHAGA